MVLTPFPKLRLTVTKVEGRCYHDYDMGDVITLEDFTHPPAHFCLGLAHALFPVVYSLSFAACFPFMENQRSLHVTCPDGGKLEFLAEVLGHDGNTAVIPKDQNYAGPRPQKLLVEVVQDRGGCTYGYKLGDQFKFEGLKCKEGFCGAAYHLLFPALFGLNFGAKFFFMHNPDSIDTVTCPDKGKIVFKVTREEE